MAKSSRFDTYGTKYHPLFEHLLYGGQGQVTMIFSEIEAVLETSLPPSAFNREEWWSNSPAGHSQARAWMRAGYETSQIDLEGKTVTFTLEGWPDGYVRADAFKRRAGAQGGFAEGSQQPFSSEQGGEKPDHPLFGIWVGKVTLVNGYDYTKPAFDADGDLVD